MENLVLFYITLLILILALQALFFLKHNKIYIGLKQDYSPILKAETVLASIKEKYVGLQLDYDNSFLELKNKHNKLSLYYVGPGTLDNTLYKTEEIPENVLEAFDSNLELLETKLSNIKFRIKNEIKNKTACTFPTDRVVNNSKREAKKKTNRDIKLQLHCLDIATKAAMSLAAWNNINRLKGRLEDIFNEINESGKIINIQITEEFFNLKLTEFVTQYEIDSLKIKNKEEEKEENRIRRQAEREEKRIHKAAVRAEKERKFYDELVRGELDKLKKLKGSKYLSLEKKIQNLQEELTSLVEKEKRAKSMAELTRAGYVYVISNEKSFGAGMCKIGMTRRVNPMERVKELGDASVPELFDVHALIYTEDAPKLEKYLHDTFSLQRVNLINKRKEFFFIKPKNVMAELKKYPDIIDIKEYA